MKNAELRREFKRICLKKNILLHEDINGMFFAKLTAEQLFEMFLAGIDYSGGTHDTTINNFFDRLRDNVIE